MLYSSKVIDKIAVVLAIIVILAMGYFLFQKPAVKEFVRPEACRESDLSLDLRSGRDGNTLSMSEQKERDERCERIMRGVAQ